jgi:hypothetical protein
MGLRPCRYILLILATFLATAAGGQTLEGVLMPGKVISGHAKLEQDCDNCHVKLNKAAQDQLCMDCHTHNDVRKDVRDKTGYHGRIKIDSCRSCHTDHKGRDVKIAAFDTKTFDHAKTDFALVGAHVKVECKTCHASNKKYREAPAGCNDCHKKDDKHKGTLGPACADCHTQVDWKETRFDHAKTKFPLLGKHVDTKCKDCHEIDAYKKAPLTCIGCHRKDDNKVHRARLGEKCESCHNAKDWKDVGAFQHDRDTKYPLRGKHRTAKCETCHTAAAPVIPKLQSTCIACHKNDDKHNNTLGEQCADCHTEKNWKEAKFDHDLSVFKLRNKHRDVECKECHKDPKSYKGVPLTCVGCHKKDDTHKDRYGMKCESCHTDFSWRDVTFRHDFDTKYRLLGRHMETRCDACHKGHVYNDKLKSDCYSCHKKDDRHKDQLGRECETCHDAVDWSRTVRFDHNKSRFPLLGRHAKVVCKECHVTQAFKDAKRECVACHEKDDKHKRTLGMECGDCHNARDWKIWDFDHSKRTKYVLDGAHVRVACVTCHKAPAPPGKPIPQLGMLCISCHRDDDPHNSSFGPQCDRCHRTNNWRDIKPFGMFRTDVTPWYLATASRTVQ